jgi:hypothetical protein
VSSCVPKDIECQLKCTCEGIPLGNPRKVANQARFTSLAEISSILPALPITGIEMPWPCEGILPRCQWEMLDGIITRREGNGGNRCERFRFLLISREDHQTDRRPDHAAIH